MYILFTKDRSHVDCNTSSKHGTNDDDIQPPVIQPLNKSIELHDTGGKIVVVEYVYMYVGDNAYNQEQNMIT